MAKIEVRVFGGKKQLVVIPDTQEEKEMIHEVIGSRHKECPRYLHGELKSDDWWQPYLWLEVGKAVKES